MTAQDTLLAQILPMFTGQTERVATEALRYILQQSEAARAALESMLSTAGVEVDSLTRFQTEAPGDEGERVDLVCYDASGDERVLIEAKFWAGLTDNQPNTYIDRLPQCGHSALLFIAPAQRMETLWPELRRIAAKANHTLSSVSESVDLRCVAIDGSERKMILTSWRAMLNLMASHAGADTKVVSDIQQLLGLTDTMDANAFLPLHSEELGPASARRIQDFLNLVSKVRDRTQSTGLVRWSRRVSNSGGSSGLWGTLADAEIWFGFDPLAWANRGDTPLWVQITGLETLEEDDALQRLRSLDKKVSELIQTDSAEWYIPLYLPTGVEESTVLDAVVCQLERRTRPGPRTMRTT